MSRIRVHPPLIFLMALGTKIGLVYYVPAFNNVRIEAEGVGYLILALGFIVLAVSLITFMRFGTTIDPLHPENASNLVISGPYRLSRNPMYLSMLLLLIGIVFKFLNPFTYFIDAIFVVIITVYQIKPEEKALGNKFGTDYVDYCKRTRSWI